MTLIKILWFIIRENVKSLVKRPRRKKVLERVFVKKKFKKCNKKRNK